MNAVHNRHCWVQFSPSCANLKFVRLNENTCFSPLRCVHHCVNISAECKSRKFFVCARMKAFFHLSCRIFRTLFQNRPTINYSMCRRTNRVVRYWSILVRVSWYFSIGLLSVAMYSTHGWQSHRRCTISSFCTTAVPGVPGPEHLR